MRPETHGTWLRMSISSKIRTRLRSFLPPRPMQCWHPLRKKLEEREFAIDSRASMHMLSKKVLSSGELETARRSKNPITVVTANGEVQTNKEARENVHDLHLFVTVQLLEDTPAVLSSGKLCEEHGFTHGWATGQKPHLTKDGKKILCETENFVPLVLLGLSSTSSTSSSPQDSSSLLNPANSRSKQGVQGTGAGAQKISKTQKCQHP